MKSASLSSKRFGPFGLVFPCPFLNLETRCSNFAHFGIYYRCCSALTYLGSLILTHCQKVSQALSSRAFPQIELSGMTQPPVVSCLRPCCRHRGAAVLSSNFADRTLSMVLHNHSARDQVCSFPGMICSLRCGSAHHTPWSPKTNC